MNDYCIFEADFSEYEQAIISIRSAVFIIEQGVPRELEIDGRDPFCHHVLAFIDEFPVATGRISRGGKIGRVAVLKKYRNLGYGRAIIAELEAIASTMGLDQVSLGAQTGATGFYQKLGYNPYGDIFMDADIPHIHMRKYITHGKT